MSLDAKVAMMLGRQSLDVLRFQEAVEERDQRILDLDARVVALTKELAACRERKRVKP